MATDCKLKSSIGRDRRGYLSFSLRLRVLPNLMKALVGRDRCGGNIFKTIFRHLCQFFLGIRTLLRNRRTKALRGEFRRELLLSSAAASRVGNSQSTFTGFNPITEVSKLLRTDDIFACVSLAHSTPRWVMAIQEFVSRSFACAFFLCEFFAFLLSETGLPMCTHTPTRTSTFASRSLRRFVFVLWPFSIELCWHCSCVRAFLIVGGGVQFKSDNVNNKRRPFAVISHYVVSDGCISRLKILRCEGRP